jgi:ethanolamine kinase
MHLDSSIDCSRRRKREIPLAKLPRVAAFKFLALRIRALFPHHISSSPPQMDSLTLKQKTEPVEWRDSVDSGVGMPVSDAPSLMTWSDLLDVPLRLDDADLTESARAIALAIFPAWSDRQLRIERITQGLTNKRTYLLAMQRLIPVMKVTVVGDAPAGTPTVLLLRSYGHGTNHFIDRASERVTLLALAATGYAPPLYGKFMNGLAYGFVAGRVVTPEELSDTDIGRRVARGMATWHRLELADLLDTLGGGNTAHEPVIWATLKRWIDQGACFVNNQRLTP